jgi:hypothetical protein
MEILFSNCTPFIDLILEVTNTIYSWKSALWSYFLFPLFLWAILIHVVVKHQRSAFLRVYLIQVIFYKLWELLQGFLLLAKCIRR